MTTLTVGPGEQFATLAGAVAASHDGDVVQVQAGTYTNDFATVNTRITIEGVGGMAQLVASVEPTNGKAILVANTDVTIDHVAFSGAAVADMNGAGIRYQGGTLTIANCDFHDNQEGILGAAAVAGTGVVTISDSDFADNGAGDGYSHNIYLGDIATLSIDQCYIHDASVGHEIKSRAETTIVTNSRIDDGPTGTASYSIDLPNGGNAVIQNDVIQQGPDSQNPVMIAYGEDGNLHADSALSVDGDTILNDLNAPSVAALWNAAPTVTASVTDDSFYGLPAAKIANGPAAVSGSVMLAVEPALDTSSAFAPPTPIAPATTLGSGPDMLTLAVAEDAWQGDAQFTVSIDGVQIGGTQIAAAAHGAGQAQMLDILGSFAGGHIVAVDFLNDAWGGTSATDRNLFVDSAAIDGTAIAGANLDLFVSGSQGFGFTAAASPPLQNPVGLDTIDLQVSEDAWLGDAQFTIAIDGTTIGGVRTATALHDTGAAQDVSISGSWGAGPHTVGVTFINDAWGGTSTTDRNLYIDAVRYDGAASSSAPAVLLANGTALFGVAGGAAAATALTVSMSEDAWNGDAQYAIAVDGVAAATGTVTALNGLGQTQTVSVPAALSVGTHDIAVSFLNDAWGGTAATDRNLYVTGIQLGGAAAPGSSAALFTTGVAHLHVYVPAPA